MIKNVVLDLLSTFGVSEDKWMFSSKATVITMISSFGGGCAGLSICYIIYKGKMRVAYIQNCVYASLVAISGGSFWPNFGPQDANFLQFF